MKQLIVVILSYLLIPILIRRKIKLSYTLLITAGLLSAFSGIGWEAILGILGSLFTSASSGSGHGQYPRGADEALRPA